MTASNALTLTMPSDLEVVVTRTLDAPRELVFDAFTKPEHMARWMGPRDLRMTLCETDLRPGGDYRFVHRRDTDGSEYAFHGVYREVVRPERVVWTFVYEGAPQFEQVDTVTFEECGRKTTVTITSRFQSIEHRNAMIEGGMERGMAEGFERMEELFALDEPLEPILRIERTFDAPRELVYRAWTDPEQFARWWGPRNFTAPHCTIDLRVGGALHVAMAWPDGRVNWSKGYFREIVPNERLISTFFFSDADGNVVPPAKLGVVEGFPETVLMRVTFEDIGGKTKLTVEQSYPASLGKKQGAFEGWNQSLDKLGEYLESASAV